MRESVSGPDGNPLYTNLSCEITFSEKEGMTEIYIHQAGFPDEESVQQCQTSWAECLDKLGSILTEQYGRRFDTLFDEGQPTL